jgi:protein gp37
VCCVVEIAELSLQKYPSEITLVLANNEEMSTKITVEDFLSSSKADRLKHPMAIASLLRTIDPDSSEFFDLTFKASFANKLFTVLRREGKSVQGFDRMQQTLAESVQQIVDLLQQLESQHHIALGVALNSSAIIELIDDLTIVKEWMNEHSHVAS